MILEFKTSVLIAIAGVVILTIGFSFPALTEGGWVGSSAHTQVIQDQHAYCEANMSDVDCACFAKKAGYIQGQEKPRVMGFRYPDQVELSRQQAAGSC